MRSFSKQFRSITPFLLIIYLLTFLVLLAAILLSTVKNISLDALTKDPTAIMDAPFYLGVFSNIGIMFWSAAAALCFFTASRLSNNRIAQSSFIFMLFSGLITLMLGLDDLFLFHETVAPKYLSISKNTVFLTYANFILIYVVYFRKQILNTDYLVLILAFVFIGLSAISKTVPLPIPKDTFLEDSLKLFGIVSWFTYYFRTSNEFLNRSSIH